MRRIVARAKNLARTWLALGLAEPTPGSLLTSFRGLEKMVQGEQGVCPAAAKAVCDWMTASVLVTFSLTEETHSLFGAQSPYNAGGFHRTQVIFQILEKAIPQAPVLTPQLLYSWATSVADVARFFAWEMSACAHEFRFER